VNGVADVLTFPEHQLMSDTLKVLVVAARADDIDRLRRALVEAGWSPELRSAATVGELDAALGERWDAVITDDALADGDSLAVLARVRKADRDVPVLVVSHEVGEERAVEVLVAGIDHFVLKGQLDRLSGALRQRLRVSHERRLRRAAESNVERTEHELRTVIDNLPIGILVRQGGSIAFVNRAVAESYGLPPAMLIGKRVIDLARAEYRDGFVQRMATTDRGETQPSYEFRFDRSDGRVGIMEVSSPTHLRFGGVPSVMVTWRDVTEERALRDRLLMSDRMAAVGTLASGVAHEINNPLACVTANLELLREELTPPVADAPTPPRLPTAEILAALDDAREGAERVRIIVRDLRLFARGDSGERGPVDLGGVLQAAERMAGNLVRARARVVQEHSPLPPVDGNATRLCQVFVNILVNAAQAIVAGAPDDNEVRVRAVLEGDRVVVEVRDTGVGIPADVRSRIFDPFFSTKGIGGGHGLGLSVCHGIVTSFGGQITVADAPEGRGTVVRVALPVYTR
jgi:PAS domain S-box-containing protein